MTWVSQWIWSHHAFKEGGFYGFNSNVPVHVFKLPHNWLNCVNGISFTPKFLTELPLGSNSFDRKFPSEIMKLDRIKKLYLFHNTIISGNNPSNIRKMIGLMDLDLSLISLHGNIPSKFGLIKELFYLDMDDTHIHGPIPGKLKKYSISNTSPSNRRSLLQSFYYLPGTSTMVVGFTNIVLLMLKFLTK